jgi:DNA-binding NarL/FixJ family response regulator
VRRDLAELIAWDGDLSEAEASARRAVGEAQRAGDRSLLLDARATQARVAILRGEAAEMLASTAPTVADETGSAADRLGLCVAEAEMVLGRHAIARERLGALRATALDRGDEPAHRATLLALAELDLRDGAWEQGEGFAAEAAALAEIFGRSGALDTGLLAYAAALMGREPECRAAAERGLRDAGEDRRALLWNHGALGVLELSLGRTDAALPHLGGVGRVVDDMGLGEPAWLPFLSDEAEALAMAGDHDTAIRRIDWLEAQGRALGRDSAIAAALRCRAVLLAETGTLADALASATAAVEAYEPLPLRFERGRSLLTLGILRRRDRQKRDAREVLQRALDAFESLGARIWQERARAEIARISGRRASLTELTESESRVARLAAAGRTNVEIARTLSMSVRTVEGHLSHAYAKLGLRSRTELAVFFERGD